MKRSTALILCTVFDLLAVVMVYFAVYQPFMKVITGLANRAEYIRYTTNFYIGFGSIAIPVLHIIGLIETYLPRYFNRSICTKVFYGSLIIFLLLGIGTAGIVKRAILHQGYFHCEGAAIHRKLLRIETYVLDEDTCRQLTLERKKRKFLGMR